MAESPAVQCDSCEKYVFHDEAKFVQEPGATLTFCTECAAPTRSQELGLGL